MEPRDHACGLGAWARKRKKSRLGLEQQWRKGINQQGVTLAEKISGGRDLVRESSSVLDTWHSLGKKTSKQQWLNAIDRSCSQNRAVRCSVHDAPCAYSGIHALSSS